MVMGFSQGIEEPGIVDTYFVRLWAALAAIWVGSLVPSTGSLGANAYRRRVPASTPPWVVIQDEMASSVWGFSPADVSSV